VLDFDLRDLDDKDAIGHFGTDTSDIDSGWITFGAESDALLEDTDLASATVDSKVLQQFFISTRSMNHTGNAKDTVFTVPINADILLLGAWKR
jgi:hypothetical protein